MIKLLLILKLCFNKLKPKDKIVGLLLDEVHCKKKVQYANGAFYGIENEQITKTLLCLMLKSVAGQYRDVICMSPISKLPAEKIRLVWRNCLQALTNIGSQSIMTMNDGL